MPVFVFFFVLIAIGVVVMAGLQRMKRVVAAWVGAAATLGLEFDRPSLGRPRINGAIAGHRVEVDICVQGSGKSRQTFTRYRVWYPSAGFEFRLTRQTALSRVTRFFGAQDVEMGDPGFDDVFVVKTQAENQLREFLRLGLQGALLRTAAAYPGIVFDHDRVTYEIQRMESSPDAIVSAVRRMVDTAEALTGRHSGHGGASVVAARARGELAEIAEKIRVEASKRAKALDDELVELDTLATAGDRTTARARLQKLEAKVPADPK